MVESSSGKVESELRGVHESDDLRWAPSETSHAWDRVRSWLAIVAFLTPTVLAAVYFGLIAAPRYESETEFLVRGVGGTKAPPGLESLMKAIGISRSNDDTNVVVDYLGSRQGVAELEAALPLRAIYGAKEADFLARFPRPFHGDSFEWLYQYYGDRVVAAQDSDTGIVTVTAQAFRPEDAQKITQRLLAQSEALVNAMNDRLQVDTVKAAETVVAEARAAVVAAHDEVTRFRNAQTVVDPTQNATAQLTTISTLSIQVDQVLAQISQTSRLSPNAPSVSALRAQADALSSQIANEQKALAGPHSATADKVSAYERLVLLQKIADESLDAATASLIEARQDARRQHVYLEVISAPNLPDESTQPHRLRLVATVFAISCALAAVWWLLTVGVREHGR